MPVLINDRHERFAQAIAFGKDEIDAYRAAFGDVKIDPAEAPKLRKKAASMRRRADVRERVAELMEMRGAIGVISIERAIAESVVDRKQVLDELAVIAFSDIGEIMDFDSPEPGFHMRDPKSISKRARRAISGIKVRRYVERDGADRKQVEVIEFKFWSKDTALDRLGRFFGLWTNEGGGEGKPKGWDETELAKYLEAQKGEGHLDS
jgi:phage terminase small subunit